ncbi:MAG: aminotransferase class V-fold PLP-dependent enzyme [Gammaproteobacteria bacterium]
MHNNNDNAKTQAAEVVRADIPLLRQGEMHYLDNAATALMPQVVMDATTNYDANTRANIGRGLHKFAEVADEHYAGARRIIAEILNAGEDEVVFTSGASAGLNLLAAALGQTLSPDDAVVLSIAEHHSNIVPWQIAAKRFGFSLRFAKITEGGAIDIDDIRKHSTDGRARVFALAHASNVSGAINDIGKLSQMAKQYNNDALVVIDGAQYIPHSYNHSAFANSGADFYVFSGHKCYAPNGIGVLWGRREVLAKLPAVIGGGGAVSMVREDGFDFADMPRRLEVGTPPITQAIGLAAAMRWSHHIPQAARQNENDLATMARRGLRAIKGVRVLFDDENNNTKYAPIVSFVMDNVHPHDCCQILSAHNVAVRGGNMCAELLMRRLSPNGCVRVSIGPYNNAADIATMIKGVREVQKLLGR